MKTLPVKKQVASGPAYIAVAITFHGTDAQYILAAPTSEDLIEILKKHFPQITFDPSKFQTIAIFKAQ